MGLFGAALGWEGGRLKAHLPKICHTHPTMMKPGTVIPYLKKIKKYMNQMTQPLTSTEISIFSPEISKFALSRNTDIDCILIPNFLIG